MLKSWLVWSCRIIFSGALVWYLINTIDSINLLGRLHLVDKEFLILAIILVVSQGVIAALRWRTVLTALGATLPSLYVFQLVYISIFFNLVLPGAVSGELVRMWKARQAGLSLVHAVNSVLLERIATVFGLFLILVVAVLSPSNRIKDTIIFYTLLFLPMIGIASIGGLMLLDRLPSVLRKYQIINGLYYLARDTRSLFLQRRYVIWLLFHVTIGHLNLVFVAFVLAQGLALDITFVDCLVLIPAVLLVTTLPISVAGLGVREYAMITAFSFIDVGKESAFALSILFGLATLAGALPGGIVWLATAGRSMGTK